MANGDLAVHGPATKHVGRAGLVNALGRLSCFGAHHFVDHLVDRLHARGGACEVSAVCTRQVRPVALCTHAAHYPAAGIALLFHRHRNLQLTRHPAVIGDRRVVANPREQSLEAVVALILGGRSLARRRRFQGNIIRIGRQIAVCGPLLAIAHEGLECTGHLHRGAALKWLCISLPAHLVVQHLDGRAIGCGL